MSFYYGDAANWIGGKWVGARSGEVREVFSPASGSAIGTIAWSDRQDAQDAIGEARSAQRRWGKVAIWQRAAQCDKIADLMFAKAEALSELLAREQGKPLAEARGEVATAADGFRMAAAEARYLEGSTMTASEPGVRVSTQYQPRGVYAVVTPWNFPVNIPVESLAPGIVMGNAIVWTPAPSTSLVAVALCRIIEEAGLPAGVINLVTGPGAVVGDEIVSSAGTNGVAFTGSAAVGKQIAVRAAGKPMTLELGGNGPAIILDDADLAAAARATASACFTNAGQICSAAERVLVHEAVYEEFAQLMAAEARALVLGDSMDPATTLGPLNNASVLQKVQSHVADAQAKGARILAGGYADERRSNGLFYPATVLADVTDDMLISQEETFGPVAPLIKFSTDDEAIRMAEEDRYGLVGSVFTQNLKRAYRFIEELPVGIVNVNMPNAYWETHIPFGGKSGKDSGVGRVGGKGTLIAMSDLKVACINVA
jgi:acyl-CoA reductase-like NAD-dependent aldehyde dehydrogenase